MILTEIRKLKIINGKVRWLNNPKVLEQFIELVLPMSLFLPTKTNRNMTN